MPASIEIISGENDDRRDVVWAFLLAQAQDHNVEVLVVQWIYGTLTASIIRRANIDHR